MVGVPWRRDARQKGFIPLEIRPARGAGRQSRRYRRDLSLTGFTLIEMLIVIAIIGILASIVLVGLGPVQRGARDSRRISDLQQVRTALELCFLRSGQYPASGSWSALAGDLLTCAGIKTIPSDPRTGATYEYGVSAARNNYVVAATLEDTTNAALATDVDGTVYGIDCGSGSPETPAKYCMEF